MLYLTRENIMRDMLTNAASIALGILVAAAVCALVGYAIRPAQSLTVDLTQYACAINQASKSVECRKK